MNPILLLLGAGAVIAYAASQGGSGPPAAPRTSPRSRLFTGTRKSDLVTFTLVNGRVQQSPESIAQLVSTALRQLVPVSVVALATMLSSESGAGSQAVRTAIAWTARNRSLQSGKSMMQVLAPDGTFGVQGQAGREFSSARPPTKSDVQLAIKIQRGDIKDPVKGATHFDHPAAQRKYVAQQAEGYAGKTPEVVAANRKKQGLTMVTLPGVSAEYVRFWTKNA